MTFSHTSASAATREGSRIDNANPPLFVFSLWHPKEYRCKVAVRNSISDASACAAATPLEGELRTTNSKVLTATSHRPKTTRTSGNANEDTVIRAMSRISIESFLGGGCFNLSQFRGI